MLVFVDNDSAAQVPTKGGRNHSLVNRLIGTFGSWRLVVLWAPGSGWLARRVTQQMSRAGIDRLLCGFRVSGPFLP